MCSKELDQLLPETTAILGLDAKKSISRYELKTPDKPHGEKAFCQKADELIDTSFASV